MQPLTDRHFVQKNAKKESSPQNLKHVFFLLTSSAIYHLDCFGVSWQVNLIDKSLYINLYLVIQENPQTLL